MSRDGGGGREWRGVRTARGSSRLSCFRILTATGPPSSTSRGIPTRSDSANCRELRRCSRCPALNEPVASAGELPSADDGRDIVDPAAAYGEFGVGTATTWEPPSGIAGTRSRSARAVAGRAWVGERSKPERYGLVDGAIPGGDVGDAG